MPALAFLTAKSPSFSDHTFDDDNDDDDDEEDDGDDDHDHDDDYEIFTLFATASGI